MIILIDFARFPPKNRVDRAASTPAPFSRRQSIHAARGPLTT
jgi:hypothetical protein